MSIDRLTRVNEIIRRGISERLIRDFSGSSVDISAMTVTRVETSSDLRQAKVFVSIYGHEDDKQLLLSRLKKHRIEFQREIFSEIRLKYTPRLQFVLDESLAGADQVYRVLNTLEQDPDMHLAEEAQDDWESDPE